MLEIPMHDGRQWHPGKISRLQGERLHAKTVLSGRGDHRSGAEAIAPNPGRVTYLGHLCRSTVKAQHHREAGCAALGRVELIKDRDAPPPEQPRKAVNR